MRAQQASWATMRFWLTVLMSGWKEVRVARGREKDAMVTLHSTASTH
jgi:hypothetical protein